MIKHYLLLEAIYCIVPKMCARAFFGHRRQQRPSVHLSEKLAQLSFRDEVGCGDAGRIAVGDLRQIARVSASAADRSLRRAVRRPDVRGRRDRAPCPRPRREI